MHEGVDSRSCLRRLPVTTLLADTGGATGATNSPILNGMTLTRSPRTAFASGRFNRVPTIMGTLRDENLIDNPTTRAQFLQDRAISIRSVRPDWC